MTSEGVSLMFKKPIIDVQDGRATLVEGDWLLANGAAELLSLLFEIKRRVGRFQ
jgi:hypothetical protein